MDGTPVQFGWPRSSWLLPANVFSAQRMVPNTNVVMSHHERLIVDQEMRPLNKGFWGMAQDTMRELFGELDWNALFVLPRSQRVEVVKEQAEKKFAGVWRLGPQVE